MPINPIFTGGMLGIDRKGDKARSARELREKVVRKESFDQIVDEAELAALDQVEQSQAPRPVKSNESEDAHDDHDEHGYYTPMGRSLDAGDEHPRVDLEG